MGQDVGGAVLPETRLVSSVTETARSFRVTVVVPTRSRVDLLQEALSSVLSSELNRQHRVEVIVVDDADVNDCASASGAVEEAVRDLPVRVVYGGGKGVSRARSLGLTHASGDYVLFLDDDDAWADNYPLDQIAFLEDNPEHDAVVSQIMLADVGLIPVAGPFPADGLPSGWIFGSLLRCVPVLSAMVVRRSVAVEIGAFDTDLTGGEDWDWALRLAKRSKIGYVDKVAVLIRQHEGPRAFSAKDRSIRHEFFVVARRYADTMKVLRRHTEQLRAVDLVRHRLTMGRHIRGEYAPRFVNIAVACSREGDFATAGRSMLLALRISVPHVLFYVLRQFVAFAKRRREVCPRNGVRQ